MMGVEDNEGREGRAAWSAPTTTTTTHPDAVLQCARAREALDEAASVACQCLLQHVDDLHARRVAASAAQRAATALCGTVRQQRACRRAHATTADASSSIMIRGGDRRDAERVRDAKERQALAGCPLQQGDHHLCYHWH